MHHMALGNINKQNMPRVTPTTVTEQLRFERNCRDANMSGYLIVAQAKLLSLANKRPQENYLTGLKAALHKPIDLALIDALVAADLMSLVGLPNLQEANLPEPLGSECEAIFRDGIKLLDNFIVKAGYVPDKDCIKLAKRAEEVWEDCIEAKQNELVFLVSHLLDLTSRSTVSPGKALHGIIMGLLNELPATKKARNPIVEELLKRFLVHIQAAPLKAFK